MESIEVSEADNKESDSVINDIDNLLAEFDNDRAITPVPECEQKSEKDVTPDVKNDIESDLNSELNNSSILDDADAMGLLDDTADQIENNLNVTETLESNIEDGKNDNEEKLSHDEIVQDEINQIVEIENAEVLPSVESVSVSDNTEAAVTEIIEDISAAALEIIEKQEDCVQASLETTDDISSCENDIAACEGETDYSVKVASPVKEQQIESEHILLNQESHPLQENTSESLGSEPIATDPTVNNNETIEIDQDVEITESLPDLEEITVEDNSNIVDGNLEVENLPPPPADLLNIEQDPEVKGLLISSSQEQNSVEEEIKPLIEQDTSDLESSLNEIPPPSDTTDNQFTAIKDISPVANDIDFPPPESNADIIRDFTPISDSDILPPPPCVETQDLPTNLDLPSPPPECDLQSAVSSSGPLKINSEISETVSEKEVTPTAENEKVEEEEVRVPSKGYNLDLDNLDDPNLNPFETKTAIAEKFEGSTISVESESPETVIEANENDLSMRENLVEGETVKEKEAPVEVSNPENENDCYKGEEITCEVAIDKETTSANENKVQLEGSTASQSDQLETKIEINSEALLTSTFENDKFTEVNSPAKDETIEPSKQKIDVLKDSEIIIEEEKALAIKTDEVDEKIEVEEIVVPSKGYNLDFLDKLDDPTLNPFETKTAIDDKIEDLTALKSNPEEAIAETLQNKTETVSDTLENITESLPSQSHEIESLTTANDATLKQSDALSLQEVKTEDSPPFDLSQNSKSAFDVHDTPCETKINPSTPSLPLSMSLSPCKPTAVVKPSVLATEVITNVSFSAEQKIIDNICTDTAHDSEYKADAILDNLKETGLTISNQLGVTNVFQTETSETQIITSQRDSNIISSGDQQEEAMETDDVEERIPPSKGYNLDFLDKLDDPNFNPFETKSAVTVSFNESAPVQGGSEDVALPPPTKETSSVAETAEAAPAPAKKLVAKKPWLKSKKKPAAEGEETEKKVKKPGKPLPPKPWLKKKEAAPVVEIETSFAIEDKVEEEEEIKVPSKGYNLDFLDNLDDPNLNPFETKTAITDKFEDSASVLSEPSEIVSEAPKSNPETIPSKPLENETLSKEKTPVKEKIVKPWLKKKVSKPSKKVEESEKKAGKDVEEDIPAVPSKGYNLDFLDNLDDPNFNPFETKTAVVNKFEDSPSEPAPPAQEFETKSDEIKSQEVSDEPVKEKPKKQLVTKPWLKKKKKPVVKEPEKTDDPELQDEVELPKKGYNLDFLDKLDDPNFNPFETKSSVTNNFETDQIVAPQSETENVVVPEKITEDKIVTEEEKTTYGGYNLDNLDDPNFNPFESKSGIQNHEEVLEDSEAVSDSTMILDQEPKQNTESVIDSNNLNTTVDIPTKDSTPEFEQNEIVTENTRDLRGESPEVDRPSVEVRPESPQSNSSGYSSIPPVPEMSFALPEPVNIEELLAHDFTQTQNSTMSDLITNQSQISGELGELAKMGLMHEERLLQKDKEVSRLNAVVKQKQAEVDQLRIKLEMHSDNNSQMMVIVDEFEKTIQQLIQDKERSQVCSFCYYVFLILRIFCDVILN